jgi:hypothetical protein
VPDPTYRQVELVTKHIDTANTYYQCSTCAAIIRSSAGRATHSAFHRRVDAR